MPLMHQASDPAGEGGMQIHRCKKGHPLNPTSLAMWQQGFGVPLSQSYVHVRKCKICSHEIPKNWERLGCAMGCEESVCSSLNCSAKVLASARSELGRRGCSLSQLEAVVLEEESLLLREAAVDSLKELGAEAESASPSLEKILLHAGWRESFHGTSSTRPHESMQITHKDGTNSMRSSVKHTYAGRDDKHPAAEYTGWRNLRVKAASVLALMGKVQRLEDLLTIHGDRPEVREAVIMGIVDLSLQEGRAQEAADFVPHFGASLSDENEAIRMAAACALRALAPSGVASSAAPQLVQALQEQDLVMMPPAAGRGHQASLTDLGGTWPSGHPRRRWRDVEGKRLFELDVVCALSALGMAATDVATKPLAARLTGTNETVEMRWAAAEALARSGAADELRVATDHRLEEVRRAAAASLERITVVQPP